MNIVDIFTLINLIMGLQEKEIIAVIFSMAFNPYVYLGNLGDGLLRNKDSVLAQAGLRFTMLLF